ncbi:gephyrin-like molybdotransferase Glp [Aliiroseovarius sp. YM-037]|uniref:molybdopterin molybdotransferase MoeA n=1 Tax=Aliiroseovarius sp. YM-037 TaxID=3341728 RepID=UPI003A7FE544
MISVEEALNRVLSLVSPLDIENIPLIEAAGRTLAKNVVATRNQPPFSASAMDGYAVIGDEVEADAMFKVIGESAAGQGYAGVVKAGQTVRIFTGAPVPEGATRVVIQEDVKRSGDVITIKRDPDEKAHTRPEGADFKIGDKIDAPRRLTASDIALLASMNIASVPVYRRPVVALLATGDELVMPGETPGPDQIIASNSFGLKAMLDAAGAETRMLPIARDTIASLEAAFSLAEGADLIVTIGGASVGDHDLVGAVAEKLGMEQSFYKVAMRPGKPLMAGRVMGIPMIGLPGNPVSSMVCGQIFILPALAVMTGHDPAPLPRSTAKLAAPLPPNGPREHYMRARLQGGTVEPFGKQDSALLTVLASANVLVVRAPNDPAREVGSAVDIIPI